MTRHSAACERVEAARRRFYRLVHLTNRLIRCPQHVGDPKWSVFRQRIDQLCSDLAAQAMDDRTQRERESTFGAGSVRARRIAQDAWAVHHGLPPPPALEILATGTYVVHHASCQAGAAVAGQVTKIAVAGLIAYVREDYDIANAFYLPSNARVGLKEQGPSRGWSVLALCAPRERWNDIARMVAAEDGLGRRVVRNARFTAAWAETIFRTPNGRPRSRDLGYTTHY